MSRLSSLLILLCLMMMQGCNYEQPENDQLVQAYTSGYSAKILLIGFDGATWSMFQTAVDKGKMPRLKGLMDEGVYGPLKTIKPTLTPVIWTTIATARLPESHGIQAAVEKDPETGTMRPLTSASSKVKPVWRILSELGREVSIVRWPLTWPVEPVQGEIISDYAFQSSRPQRTFPDTLTALVDARKTSFKLDDITPLTEVDETRYQSLASDWQWKLMVLLREYSLDVQYKNIARTLFEKKQRNFSAVYFYSLDALGHNFYRFLTSPADSETPEFSNLLMNWCWLYDQFLGEILDSVDPETYVIICSDHGMEMALKPKNFLILSQDSPPVPGSESAEVITPPGPPYDTDPFSVKLLYTLPSGQHVNKPDGVFLIAGPQVRKGIQVPDVRVTEIIPTILYLMGLPIADDFDGKPRLDLFDSDFTSKQIVKRTPTYENEDGSKKPQTTGNFDKEDALLLNRLEALGYIR